MIKAETHLGMFLAETHLGMTKVKTAWLPGTSAPAAFPPASPRDFPILQLLQVPFPPLSTTGQRQPASPTWARTSTEHQLSFGLPLLPAPTLHLRSPQPANASRLPLQRPSPEVRFDQG